MYNLPMNLVLRSRKVLATICFSAALMSSVIVSLASTNPPSCTVFVPMRDGISLSTDLYFPTGQTELLSVILIRTPYGRTSLAGYGQYFSSHGYVVAVQDVRGRYDSEGEWVPFLNEGTDGYDTVEWLATQEWSTGRVGMYGGSYSAFAQFAAALLKPPHLLTIIPNISAGMPFDGFPYVGGALLLGSTLRWVDLMESAETPEEMARLSGEHLDIDWTRLLDTLPVVDLDQTVVGCEVDYWRDWVAHNAEDDYWESVCYLDDLSSLELPVFLQSGWFDPGSRGTLLAYLSLAESRNKAIKMVMGPWAHTDQSSPYVYGEFMGDEADIGLMDLYVQWFDYWLLGEKNNMLLEPLVQIFTIGSNEWIEGDEYPLASTHQIELQLGAASSSSSQEGCLNRVSEQQAGGSEFSVYEYDPGNPSPCFSEYLRTGIGEEYGRAIADRTDVVVFDTPPLEAPLTIAGPVSMTLYAESSCVDTDWCVTVCGITPTGDSYSVGMTWGVVRASLRDSRIEPALLMPGTVYEYEIDLSHTGFTLPTGDRLRVVVSSSAFPEFSRNLNTGLHSEITEEYVVAHQTVFHSDERPSRLVLWVAD